MSENQKPLSISELTSLIKNILEGTLTKVCVEGEISNFRQQPSGHLYFTLKDEGAQLSVVMFRSDAARLKFRPQDGQNVIVRGGITVYPPRGNYQLRATSIQPRGQGALQERFEALKRKLAAEGLFADERKRALPVFPRKVGIITSPTGAAVRDFLQILTRRCPRISVQVFGVKVQGEGSAQEIAAAVEELNQRGEVEAIVLARGGGSLEDLWSFNEEAVARAVAASKIPTVSAVGHEIDFTICDFAADLRAPTPSAAAELLSKADEEWKNELAEFRAQLTQTARFQLEDLRKNWEILARSYIFREPQKMVEQHLQRMDELQSLLTRSATYEFNFRREQFDSILKRWRGADPARQMKEFKRALRSRIDQLRLLSPQETLQRGYSIVFDRKGAVIKRRKRAIAAKNVNVRLSDGDVRMKVNE